MDIKQLYGCFQQSSGISTDTRKELKDTLFFTLKGENFNGNLFIEQAFEKGAKYVMADELKDKALQTKFGDRLIIVPDALKSLQQLSGHHRQQFKCPVLAITGSNGKTTTKELMAAVLSQKFKTYFTQGNLNNHIGIPQTLLSIPAMAEFVIIEMGANHQGEIASYCEYVQPEYGLITNVGMAHTEGFGGFEGVVIGKTELYRYILSSQGTLFVCIDNEILMEKSAGVKERITYGKSAEAFCRGEIATERGETLSVIVPNNSEKTTIRTNLVGDYNFENVMSAVCVGKYFGVALESIKQAIEDYAPTNNRSQKIAYGSNTVILDAYNANPSSMTEALKNFERISAPEKMVIIGQMMELGEYSEKEHHRIADMVQSMMLTKKVFVGSGFSFLKKNPDVIYFETTDELKNWFQLQRFENLYMLIKGSRKNELEKVLKS